MEKVFTALSILSSVGAAVGFGYWLRRFADHALSKKLKDFESELRKKVDEYLGDKAADRQYRLDARKRLYTVVGPLKFQLVLAADDFVNRIKQLGTGSQDPITYKGYFGRSTLYRLLRVFGLAELIERQVTHADFAVDNGVTTLIKFKQRAFECLSRQSISLGHPLENWNEQRQHIFYDELAIIASDMIIIDPSSNQTRVRRFDEFVHLNIDPDDTEALFRAIPRILKDFTPNLRPVLWTRLVALATLCHSFVSQEAPTMGLTAETFHSKEVLKACTVDEHLRQNWSQYEQMLKGISEVLS
jgi:hypothetical protein